MPPPFDHVAIVCLVVKWLWNTRRTRDVDRSTPFREAEAQTRFVCSLVGRHAPGARSFDCDPLTMLDGCLWPSSPCSTAAAPVVPLLVLVAAACRPKRAARVPSATSSSRTRRPAHGACRSASRFCGLSRRAARAPPRAGCATSSATATAGCPFSRCSQSEASTATAKAATAPAASLGIAWERGGSEVAWRDEGRDGR